MAKVCTIAGLLRSTPPPVLPSRSRPSSMRRPLVYKSRTPTNHPQIPAVLREVAGGCALGGPLCSQHRRCPTAVAAVRVLQAGGPPPLSCIESPYFWESFSQNCPGCLVFASTSFFFQLEDKIQRSCFDQIMAFPDRICMLQVCTWCGERSPCWPCNEASMSSPSPGQFLDSHAMHTVVASSVCKKISRSYPWGENGCESFDYPEKCPLLGHQKC